MWGWAINSSKFTNVENFLCCWKPPLPRRRKSGSIVWLQANIFIGSQSTRRCLKLYSSTQRFLCKRTLIFERFNVLYYIGNADKTYFCFNNLIELMTDYKKCWTVWVCFKNFWRVGNFVIETSEIYNWTFKRQEKTCDYLFDNILQRKNWGGYFAFQHLRQLNFGVGFTQVGACWHDLQPHHFSHLASSISDNVSFLVFFMNMFPQKYLNLFTFDLLTKQGVIRGSLISFTFATLSHFHRHISAPKKPAFLIGKILVKVLGFWFEEKSFVPNWWGFDSLQTAWVKKLSNKQCYGVTINLCWIKAQTLVLFSPNQKFWFEKKRAFTNQRWKIFRCVWH